MLWSLWQEVRRKVEKAEVKEVGEIGGNENVIVSSRLSVGLV
jgi:hypothetical protein